MKSLHQQIIFHEDEPIVENVENVADPGEGRVEVREWSSFIALHGP